MFSNRKVFREGGACKLACLLRLTIKTTYDKEKTHW